MKSISYAESGKYKVSMKDHIEDVKLKHPEKYQAMIEKAKGNITDCKNCHDVSGKGKKHSNPAPPDFQGK